jgi:hypothetical protein
MRDRSLTVRDNAKHLTVSQCHEHLMRLDELIEKRGKYQRYLESRDFFARELERCMEKREEPYHD